MIRGKMSYLALELLDGAPADARSDLFSLGVVLHELLSGQRLFMGENDFEIIRPSISILASRPARRSCTGTDRIWVSS